MVVVAAAVGGKDGEGDTLELQSLTLWVSRNT
jgi:hypothetical protein